MEGRTTSYRFGYEFANWLLADGIEITPGESCMDIPDGDYSEMKRQGVEPSQKEYWEGFNDRLEEEADD
jgi:hypothetical protein